MNESEKERLIKKDIESIENRVRHAFNQGYEMGLKESRSEIPNKWIPVSERVPEENGRYFVYLNTKVFPIRILHFAKNLNEISLDFNCSFKRKKAGWYDYDSENGFFEWTGVEAWMPFPEPYKAESEVQE